MSMARQLGAPRHLVTSELDVRGTSRLNPAVTRRGQNLLARHPDVIDAALRDERQLLACSAIRDLIEDQRALTTPSDYYEYQRRLFGHVYRAEEAKAEAARNLKRARAGRRVPAAPSGDWELELMMADRIVRQFRSVGDALAWRAFNFDRRIILALSRNAGPGPMVGKAGLQRELGEVMAAWEHEKSFALLHDLTNCVRIADVTKFTGGRALLVEVKEGRGRIRRKQMRRMQRVLDVINSGAPLPGDDGDVHLFKSRQPFKTHLKRLGEALHLSDQTGTASVHLGDQWVVNCVSVLSRGLKREEAAALAESQRLRTVTLSKAGLGASGLHRLRGVSMDTAARDPGSAPFSIFPFDSGTCARLTCDYLAFEHLLGWDRVAAAFRGEGFETECPLPEGSGEMGPGEPVLVARRRDRTITIHAAGMSQILFEMVDPRRYAAAVRELTEGPPRWGAGVFTFANERAVWR